MTQKSFLDKLDPYGRRQIASGLPPEGIEVSIRLAKDINPEQEMQMQQAGLEVYSTIDDLVIGWVPDGTVLNNLVRLAFIKEVQISRPLYNDAE
jgi:hypothetical protein